MILIDIFRNKDNKIYGFTAQNHGDSIVCAGVSAIVLTTINAIEAFTDVEFELICDEDKGIIDFCITSHKEKGFEEKSQLLLDSMTLGLKQIKENYSEQINISDCEV